MKLVSKSLDEKNNTYDECNSLIEQFFPSQLQNHRHLVDPSKISHENSKSRTEIVEFHS